MGTHSKFPQAHKENEALLCLLQLRICVSRPCEVLSDVDSKKLKAADPFHWCPVDDDGGVFSLLSPKSTTSSLVLLMLSERWFSWHQRVRACTSSPLNGWMDNCMEYSLQVNIPYN